MKKVDLSKLSVEDLKKQIASATEAFGVKKTGHKVTPLENPLTLRHERRAIARLKTELTKRENQA